MERYSKVTLPPRKIWGNAFIENGYPPVSTYTNAVIFPKNSAHGGHITDGEMLANPALISRYKGEMPFYSFDGPMSFPENYANTSVDQAIYAGWLFGHYGHFLLETLCRLWLPQIHETSLPIVFHAGETVDAIYAREAQAKLLNALGIPKERIIIVNGKINVGRLYVPWPMMIIRHKIHRSFITFTQSLRCQFQGAQNNFYPRIYLSREKLNRNNRQLSNENLMRKCFEKQGFVAVHLENMTFDEQITLFDNAEIVAGLSGSAFHGLLFTQNRPRIIYIIQEPTVNANIAMIDKAREDNSEYWFLPTAHNRTINHETNYYIPTEINIEKTIKEFIEKNVA